MGAIPESATGIIVLLILLPGFVTTFVERSLAFDREPTAIMIIGKSLLSILRPFLPIRDVGIA
jgi:hypothetical protein